MLLGVRVRAGELGSVRPTEMSRSSPPILLLLFLALACSHADGKFVSVDCSELRDMASSNDLPTYPTERALNRQVAKQQATARAAANAFPVDYRMLVSRALWRFCEDCGADWPRAYRLTILGSRPDSVIMKSIGEFLALNPRTVRATIQPTDVQVTSITQVTAEDYEVSILEYCGELCGSCQSVRISLVDGHWMASEPKVHMVF